MKKKTHLILASIALLAMPLVGLAFRHSRAVLTATASTSAPAQSKQTAIVNTTHQKYTYKEMMADLDELQKKYPECISVEKKGTTSQGRQLPILYFGNQQADKKIMVTAAIHAREYMTAQLVMAMLEYYAKNYKTGKYGEETYSTLFNKVCLVIMPMVNPDGVMIAQDGAEGTTTEEARKWVETQVKNGNRADQIKSNARGVDLNRNFSHGFGKDPHRVGKKSFDHFNGTSAYSETECKLMKEVAKRHTYQLFLNYHTHGNLLYYGCKDASLSKVNDKALSYAKLVQNTTGYKPKAETDPAYGSWADEVEYCFNTPSVTIEVGTRNPVPISEFSGIFKRNKNVWASLAASISKGSIK